MSTHVIKIPDIGEGIAEVELVEWLVKVGERVHEDQNVVSVMTDKVSVDISSPVAGVVQSVGGNAGDILLVGADLISIQRDGASTGTAEEKTEKPQLKTSVAAASNPEPPTERSPHHELVKGVLASPAVRKRVADLGYELADVANASGIARVEHGDVDRYILAQQGGGTPEAKKGAVPTRSGAQRSSSTLLPQVESETGVPLRGLRRQIARKMQRSAQEIPHFSYVEAVDVTDLEALRALLNQKWAMSRGHLTLLPFLVKALCLAIKEHPQINATFDSATQVVNECTDVNMGIATQTAAGLMVPVLHQAQQLSVWELAASIRLLSEGAKEGGLSLQQATGSTITLSSLGGLGGVAATPIINSPELALIGVNKIVEQPVVIEGKIVIRKMMNLSSSFDHRIIDGYDAAAFIQAVRRLIETPALLFIS